MWGYNNQCPPSPGIDRAGGGGRVGTGPGNRNTVGDEGMGMVSKETRATGNQVTVINNR